MRMQNYNKELLIKVLILIILILLILVQVLEVEKNFIYCKIHTLEIQQLKLKVDWLDGSLKPE